jgi:hypothetical protein
VYAHTSDAKVQVKKHFREQLVEMIRQQKGYRALVVGGDFNCGIGREARQMYPGNVGPHTINKSNRTGKEIAELCAEQNLAITNTFTKQVAIDKYVWIHTKHTSGHLLDYMLLAKTWSLRALLKAF